MKLNSSTKRRLARFALAMMLCIALCMVMSIASFAADEVEDGTNNLVTNIKSGLGSAYKTVAALVTPVAVLTLVFAAFKFFYGGERGVETAKKTILYLLFGVLLASLAPLIVITVSSWVDNSGDVTSVFGG